MISRSLTLLLVALAAPAMAQEIVVTGDRRPQNLESVAGNTAVLGRDVLERVDPQVASEALNRLPGVAIHRNNGVENLPAIRSPVLTGGQSAGSFLVLEDGVPIRAPGFGNVNDLFETDLEFADSIEVVRGPGSALYGSNAVHGIVNVITPEPGIRDVRDRVELSAGSFGRVSGVASRAFGTREGAVDNPLLGFAGVSLSHEDGWRADASVDQQKLLLGANAAYLGPWTVDGRFTFQNLNQETAAFVQGANAYDSSTLARANAAPNAFRDQQLVRAQVTLSRELGPGEFRVTPYARWIDAELLLSFFPSQALESSGQTGGGVQSAYYWDPSDTVSFIVGVDADVTEGRLREVQTLADQPNGYLQGVHYDYVVDMRALAAFAQARWRFAPDWTLTAGLRGENVRYEYDNQISDGDFGRFRRSADRTDEFNAVTPKLGVVWNAATGQDFFLSLTRGARPPQITDLYSLQTLQNPGEQDEETIDSAELGWRGSLGVARFETSLYHMDKRDTSFRNADGFTINDGRTRHEGIEIAAEAPVTTSITLSGWVTYARHTYRFADPSGRAGESIVAGNDVDSAPRWIWNTRATWTPLTSLMLELEWSHMGEYFTNAENTRTYPGHDILNLRGEYALSDRVDLFAAIRNLTNTDYAERADFAFGNDRYFPGEDRGITIGVRARY